MRLLVAIALVVVSPIAACSKGEPGPKCKDLITKVDKLCSDPNVKERAKKQCEMLSDLVDGGASQAQWDESEEMCAMQASAIGRALGTP